jgi:hypothetical protein
MRPVRFATMAGQGDAHSGSQERLVNLFAEPAPAGSTSDVVLRNTPGLYLSFAVGTGPVHLVTNDTPTATYIVSGSSLYRRTAPNGVQTIIAMGDIGAPASTGVNATPFNYTSAENTDFVVVCSPPNAYAAKLTDLAVHKITATDQGIIPGISSVAYVGGYFVFTVPDSSQFFVSAALDPNTYDALDFATADTAANILLRAVSHLDRLWLLGQNGVEIWTLSGNDFPFILDAGGYIPYGVASATSISIADNSIFFLSTTSAVMRTVGYKVQRVSTDAIEAQIRDYLLIGTASVSGAAVRGISFSIEGKEFYALTLQWPGNPGRTWVFNCATTIWHEQSTSPNGVGRWRVNCGAGGLLGDAYSGAVYALSDSTPNDGGSDAARIAVSSPVWNNTALVFQSRFEIDCERGSSTPVQLDWSDDDGVTWKGGRQLSLQARRSVATRMGSFRKRTYRLTFPSVHMRVYGAYALASGGDQ